MNYLRLFNLCLVMTFVTAYAVRAVEAVAPESALQSVSARYKKLFKSDVLDKYFPVAKVLCEKEFPRLSAKSLLGVYSALVDEFDKKRWHYFLDSPKGFDGRYLKKIIHELRVYAEFLDLAMVDAKTGKLVVPGQESKKVVDLKTYWKKILQDEKDPKVQTLFDEMHAKLYALLADFLFIKMYSYAMRLTPNKNAIKDFTILYGHIYKTLTKLSGSKYEHHYQEALKVAQRIMKNVESRTKQGCPVSGNGRHGGRMRRGRCDV